MNVTVKPFNIHVPENVGSILGYVSILYIAAGTSLNLTSLSFFLTRPRTLVSTFLYSSLALVDGFTCLAFLPVSEASFNSHKPILFDSATFCNMWSVLWNITQRLSICIIGLLSITRAICVVKPFRFINRKVVLRIVYIYTAILFAQQTFPYWYGHQPRYLKKIMMCNWSLDMIFKHGSLERIISKMIFIQFEILIPAFGVFSCNIILIIVLVMDKNSHRFRIRGEANKKAARTIIALTIIFFIFTSPVLIIFQASMFETVGYSNILLHKILDRNNMMIGFVLYSSHAFALNSCINPVMCLTMIKEYRAYIKRIFWFNFCSLTQKKKVKFEVNNEIRSSCNPLKLPFNRNKFL